MVGDLGESLWLKEIFSSVYGEKRPFCHIGILKQNEKSTQYKLPYNVCQVLLEGQGCSPDHPD